jgi:hypothetical protein
MKSGWIKAGFILSRLLQTVYCLAADFLTGKKAKIFATWKSWHGFMGRKAVASVRQANRGY